VLGARIPARLREYMDFLLKWGVLKQRVEAGDLMTNELIGEIKSLRCRCDRENGAGVPAALALVGSAVTDSRTPASRRRR